MNPQISCKLYGALLSAVALAAELEDLQEMLLCELPRAATEVKDIKDNSRMLIGNLMTLDAALGGQACEAFNRKTKGN